jgi:hypothetical protein
MCHGHHYSIRRILESSGDPTNPNPTKFRDIDEMIEEEGKTDADGHQ